MPVRNDYFTFGELRDLLHISSKRLHIIMNQPDSFRALRVRNTYVIPKHAFFAWYRLHHHDGSLREILHQADLDYKAVYTEEGNWLDQRSRTLSSERNKQHAEQSITQKREQSQTGIHETVIRRYL